MQITLALTEAQVAAFGGPLEVEAAVQRVITATATRIDQRQRRQAARQVFRQYLLAPEPVRAQMAALLVPTDGGRDVPGRDTRLIR